MLIAGFACVSSTTLDYARYIRSHLIYSPGFECGHELSLKTHEIPKRWIMSIWHNGCYQMVDVVRQSILSDGQYFQTGAVVRQPLLSDSVAIMVMKFRH